MYVLFTDSLGQGRACVEGGVVPENLPRTLRNTLAEAGADRDRIERTPLRIGWTGINLRGPRAVATRRTYPSDLAEIVKLGSDELDSSHKDGGNARP